MTEYAVLLSGDEAPWENASEEERRAVYARHDEFTRLLGERGHTITGGAQLAHSSGAKLVRGTLDQATITDGPFTESVEQLGGFYLVQTDNLDDLLQICGILVDEDAIEVRECLPAPDDSESETAAT